VNSGDSQSAALSEFAQAHGLTLAPDAELPADGDLLGKDALKLHGAATGSLPGGEPGTLCHLSYTYRSNDATHTATRTAAVLRVSESIGFAPYLAAGGTGGLGRSVKRVDLAGGGEVRAAEEIDDAWLTELLSPAFTEWIHRSSDDFEWELANGVLCASRHGYLTGESDLARLCTDAALIAKTVREESLEEVDSGQATRSAAKPTKLKPQDQLVNSILAKTTFGHPPTDIASARAQFREVVVRHPSTYLMSFFMTLLVMLIVNVIGGGIYGLLLNLPNPGRAVLIYQGVLFVVVGFFVLRRQINGTSQKLATEGFWQQYVKTRGLTVEDPSSFAATHAKADLPGNPVRVMTGAFDGVPGSLMITGDGLKRGDSIALVAGEAGPTATAEFDVSAPGASAEALDRYAADLVLDLKTRP
jgi:hypothetical protein